MKKILLVGLLSLFSVSGFSQSELLELDVSLLSHDSLKGREMGTKSEIIAAEYIASRMMQVGLTPKGTRGSDVTLLQFMQDFSVTPRANPHSKKANKNAEPISGMNVIGYKDNGANKIVVIGAHFDHLGTGSEGSLHAAKDGQIHNGADDNASGVGLLLQLAEYVTMNRNLENSNYLFIAFSGEEKGLWGSNYFCKNPTIDLKKVNYMINFDMVGRLQEDKGLAISGVGTSPAWKDQLNAANVDELKLILTESGVGPSDHTSFYLQDIPVLHFFTGQHSDYHKPSDDVEKINFQGMFKIKEMVADLMMILDPKERLVFTKTKEEENNTPRFTVTLGVMPDYLFQGEGMRLDGVTEGRPASKAGFEKGDIVIKMGDMKVDGMQSYMKALSRYKKGDKTKVTVKRGEKEITKKVEF